MIKRSIILIGIEGEIPDPLPRRGVRINKEKAILLFGTVQRKENDHFKSLDLALSLKSQDRKLFVVEKTIAFDPKALHFQWEDIVPHSFDSLAQGEILLSTALASAFDRYYQIAKKQDLYLLEGVLEGTRFLRGLTKRHPVMVGREKELFELSEILEQSFEDRGQIASIIGEGGMGKTRLWLEFEKSLEKQHVLHFKAGFTLNDNQPYVGFQNLFGSLFAHFKSDLDLSPTHQAFLNYFLSPQDQHPIIAKLGAEDIKQNITETILTILSKLKDQKMVFILDDMHWADEASIELLEKIVPQIPTTHHMWLLIHRPDFVPTFERELFFHSLTLQNLAVEQMEAQIKNILDLNYIAPSALKKIHHHSKGNPFFVEEIFRHSLDQKLIEPKTKIIQDLPLDKGIPLNIEAMIQARLDQLQTETFQTLQWLCVLGSTFLWDEAVFILDQEGFDAQTILENLQKEKYISEISAFPENRWGFYHDLIVETLRSNNIETSHFQKMNHQIGTYLVEFYQEEKHKHIERICDFLLQAPFKKDYTPLFEEAGKKAFGLNQFQKTNLYFGHLNTNQTLKHEHFSMYAQSLINTNDLNTLEDFLKTWAKIASVETEDPENGYYRYYFQFLFIQYEPQKIIYQIESVIEKYRQLYPHKTLDSLTRYQLESLGTLRKTSQLIHKGFQYLRTLNMQNSVSQYKLIPLHLISHTASDTGDQYQILSLDFVNKGMVIIQNNPSIQISQQILILGRYGTFQTIHRCNYILSQKVWKTIIDLRIKNFFLSNLDNDYLSLIINLFFAGRYKEAQDSFEAMKKYVQNKNVKCYSSAAFWICLMYILIGREDLFYQTIKLFRFFKKTDVYNRSIRFYSMAHYHLYKKDFRKASVSFHRMENIYIKSNATLMKTDARLLFLTAKIQADHQITPEEIHDIATLLRTKTLLNSYNAWSFKMHALTLARFTDHDFGYDTDQIHPKDCPNALLKQKMYVEKIKLLDHQKRTNEADQLRQEFTQYRKQLSLNMPEDMAQSFLERPLFPVP